jgi:hypothetical protein
MLYSYGPGYCHILQVLKFSAVLAVNVICYMHTRTQSDKHATSRNMQLVERVSM